MVSLLKFENEYVISSTRYSTCDYLYMLRVKVKHVNKNGPKENTIFSILQLYQYWFGEIGQMFIEAYILIQINTFSSTENTFQHVTCTM